jgi:DNA ligase-associated metallophosphoesterase
MVYDDLDVLDSLIARFAPETVLFLGDLFHSSPNQEWELFHQWLVARHQLRFVLIEGNHDQYNDNHQVMSALDARSSLLLGPFYFSHHPEESPTHVNICGHLHPGVRLEGKGRQSITLPGFWLSERQLVMPAFGNLTGKMVPKKLSCRTFAIAGGNVLEVTQRR